ncbi:MAG: hypothetical protein Q8R98_10920 [Rubrivivax sp.]|nr:hypothetical protein [Rubrivivax sp.]MDP3612355.1 hypothetical protein [Rubrivivax sp.]
MKASRRWLMALLAAGLAACTAPAPVEPAASQPTKDFGEPPGVRDSVYRVIDRRSPPPAGYGLYTVVLVRSANRPSVQLLSELFATTSHAADAAMARQNLNLMTIPVKNAAEATPELATARQAPLPHASMVLNRFYDYGQAALLMASICRPERGEAVMKACGSVLPDGPLLVTALRPVDASSVSQRLLVVNLGSAAPGAMPEVLAAYKRQLLRKDFADRAEIDGWRLVVLNGALNAAQLLPGISKAYAAAR